MLVVKRRRKKEKKIKERGNKLQRWERVRLADFRSWLVKDTKVSKSTSREEIWLILVGPMCSKFGLDSEELI